MEKLCQLASDILDRKVQQELSVPPPTPVTPVVKTRVRSSHYFPLFRRRRRRILPTNILQTSSQPPISILTTAIQTSVPPSSSSPPGDYSCDSPVNLYWLFQDNITTSRTHSV